MNILLIVLILAVISVILALRDARGELSVPASVTEVKIKRKKGVRGVILFLSKKIIHYSSDSSS